MNDSQKGGARLMKSEHKRRELAPLLAIFGILVGLALASLLTPEREFSPNENRYLQLKPSLTWTTLMDGTFTQKAEDYVADQIALRDRWMEASSLVQRAALRLEINDTWLGRDGRYFAKVTPDTFDSAQYEKNLAQVKDFFDANPDKDCPHDDGAHPRLYAAGRPAGQRAAVRRGGVLRYAAEHHGRAGHRPAHGAAAGRGEHVLPH